MTARGPALQLTNVTRGDGAEYWCEAANSEGVGQSGRVTVTVDIQPSLSLSTSASKSSIRSRSEGL